MLFRSSIPRKYEAECLGISKRSAQVHGHPSSLRPTKYSQYVMLILIFSLLEPHRCDGIWLAPNLVQGSFTGAPSSLDLNSTTILSLFCKTCVYITVSLISGWAYLINGLLLNLQQLIPLTVALRYPNSESLYLPSKREVGCLQANSATMEYCLPLLPLCLSQCPSLSKNVLFQHVIHTSYPVDYSLPKIF